LLPTSFLSKIDLKNAYRNIPIHPHDFEHTGLSWKFSGETSVTHLFDCKLPFGSSKSCQIFERISESVSRMMARRKIRVFVYIDDMLCVGDDEVECQLVFDTLLKLLSSLGLPVNEKKCFRPASVMTFLGVKIDCVARTLSLPDDKLLELKRLVGKWVKKRRATKLEIQKFAGKLNWASRVVRGGRTFMRRVLDLLLQVRESHHHVRINARAREDISWWHFGLKRFHGHVGFKCDQSLPNYVFASDACLVGGGAYFGSDWLYSAWGVDFPELLHVHINALELFIVFLALKRWGSLLAGAHVLIRSDNFATVSALNKSTSRGVALMPIIREIVWLCVEYNLLISSSYIEGAQNVLADRISRLHSMPEAIEARFLLTGNSTSHVICKNHMSKQAFDFLQMSWISDSKRCS
jgi:hypothetical protein